MNVRNKFHIFAIQYDAAASDMSLSVQPTAAVYCCVDMYINILNPDA